MIRTHVMDNTLLTGGSGRDGYIHMRDEFRVGKFYMPKEDVRGAKRRGGTSSLDQ